MIERFANQIICGDVIEVLSQLPSESVDLVLTDPPYFISQKDLVLTRKFKGKLKNINLDYGEWDRQWKTEEEFFGWVEKWFKELARIMKPNTWIYIFFDKQRLGYFDLILGPKYGIKGRNLFCWVKQNPVPSFRKMNFVSAIELAWVGSKGRPKIKNFLYQKEMANYFVTPNKAGYGHTTHPTEKPVSLFQRLIQVNSLENDIVLDPFFGSGTTGVAALSLNRRFIGIEINPEYVKIAEERIKKIQNNAQIPF